MNKILVTGVGGPAGSNLAGLILARNHRLVCVDMRETQFPGAAFFTVPAAGHPSFLQELLRIAEREKVDLLIPTVTEELPYLAREWGAMTGIPAMIGSSEAVHAANDKFLTCELLAGRGVRVPRYCLPSQLRSSDDLAEKLGWPCISKPRVGRGGRGVKVRTAGEWEAVAALDDRHILQEFMPGTDYAPNVYLARSKGRAAKAIVLEKTRLKEGLIGNAAEVLRVEAPDVEELAISAGLAMDFNGPLDVDIRRGPDGRPAVLEINARFGANIAHAPEILETALADWLPPR